MWCGGGGRVFGEGSRHGPVSGANDKVDGVAFVADGADGEGVVEKVKDGGLCCRR